MVTNRDRKSFGLRRVEKIPEVTQTTQAMPKGGGPNV